MCTKVYGFTKLLSTYFSQNPCQRKRFRDKVAFRLEESFHFSKNFFCKDAKGPFVSCNVFDNDMNYGRFNQIMANSKARKCLFIDLKKAIVFHRSQLMYRPFMSYGMYFVHFSTRNVFSLKTSMNQWTKCTKLPGAKLQRIFLNKKGSENCNCRVTEKKLRLRKTKFKTI